MPIEPKEIDPIVQSALKDRLAQIFAAPTALDPVAARVRSAGVQRWRETARRYAANFWAAGGSMVASLLLASRADQPPQGSHLTPATGVDQYP